jgi:hypothetical protein
VEIKLHAFSYSALDGGKWPASGINYFTLGKEPPLSIEKNAR